MIRPFPLAMLGAAALAAACGRASVRGGADRHAHGAPPAVPERESDDHTAALAARLASPRLPPVLAADADGSDLWKQVRRLYAAAGGHLVWIEDGKPRDDAEALKRAVARAAEEGLDPARYDVSAVDQIRSASRGWNPLKGSSLDPVQQADLDVSLTAALVEYGTHLVRGRVKPGKVDPHWFGTQRADDVVTILLAGLDAGRLEEALRKLLPQHAQYAALRRALARYRDMAAHGGWPALPSGVALRPGRAAPAVAVLRARLVASGDLPAETVPAAAPAGASAARSSTAVAPVLDRALQDGLRRFQGRHGLEPSGRVDRATRAALDVPVQARIRQIELNMERWRWLPETLGERYILVNVPTFRLTAIDQGRAVLEMRIVAGKQDSPTPIFSDAMTTVVFSPYWNVPPQIAREETIPALLRDPGYLAQNDLEVVRGAQVLSPWSIDWSNPGRIQFRQRPGARNALGQVKFLFPNQFDVYLHDTPADSLFATVARDYSHGCVRVEKPFELAQWVLAGQEPWTPEKIRTAMESGREQHVALRRQVPVYIVYETVWVDDDGTVEFRDDVYGHDAQQDGIVPGSPPPPTVATTGGARSVSGG